MITDKALAKLKGLDIDTIEYLIRSSLTWFDLDDKIGNMRPITITNVETFYIESLGMVRFFYWIRIGEIRTYDMKIDKYTETKRILNLRKLGI